MSFKLCLHGVEQVKTHVGQERLEFEVRNSKEAKNELMEQMLSDCVDELVTQTIDADPHGALLLAVRIAETLVAEGLPQTHVSLKEQQALDALAAELYAKGHHNF